MSVTYTTGSAELNVIRSKVPAFHKGYVDLTLRYRVAFPLMRKWGNLLLGVDISWARIWNAKNALPETEEWHDQPDQDFNPGPEQQQYTLQEGALICKDTLSEQQYEKVQGSRTQIINLYTEKLKDVQQSMQNKLNYQFYHGMSTGKNLGGLDLPLGTGTTSATTDIVAKPDTSYAGQATDVGAAGFWGTATGSAAITAPNASIGTDWPLNVHSGNAEYDWNSPLMLVNNGPWASGTSWSVNAFDQLKFYQSVQKQRGGKVTDPTAPLTAIMGGTRQREFSTLCEARNYRLEPVEEAKRMGMPRTLNHEDVWITCDSDVAENDCYFVQPDMLEFYTGPTYKNIWKVEGPFDFRPEFRFLYNCRTIGNFRLQPKFLGNSKDY